MGWVGPGPVRRCRVRWGEAGRGRLGEVGRGEWGGTGWGEFSWAGSRAGLGGLAVSTASSAVALLNVTGMTWAAGVGRAGLGGVGVGRVGAGRGTVGRDMGHYKSRAGSSNSLPGRRVLREQSCIFQRRFKSVKNCHQRLLLCVFLVHASCVVRPNIQLSFISSWMLRSVFCYSSGFDPLFESFCTDS